MEQQLQIYNNEKHPKWSNGLLDHFKKRCKSGIYGEEAKKLFPNYGEGTYDKNKKTTQNKKTRQNKKNTKFLMTNGVYL